LRAKYTQEEIENLYLSKGYKVLSEYQGVHKPIDIMEIKTGYMFESTVSHFQNGELREPFGYRNRKFQKYNIELYLQNNCHDVTFVDVQKQKKKGKTRNIVTLKCKCGKIFTKEWNNIISSKRVMCAECARKHQTQNRRKTLEEEYVARIESMGYHFETKPKRIVAHELVDVVENKTGYKVKVDVCKIQHRMKDIIFSDYSNRDNLIYNLNIYFTNNDMDCRALRITDKTNSNNRSIIEYRCGCGRLFYTTAHKIKRKMGYCNYCNNIISKNERLMEQFLQSLNIEYDTEYTFHSCKDHKPLPFDFHLTQYDCLIEIDGEQHFKAVCFGGISQEEAQQKFEAQQHRDKIKDDFCKNNNIPLLRIPYWEFKNDNYKQIFLDFIKPFKSNDLE
jgi:hypothetical protein